MISADMWVTYGIAFGFMAFLLALHVFDETRWRKDREREEAERRSRETAIVHAAE